MQGNGADPGSGAFVTPVSGIPDGKKIWIRVRDPGSMPHHFSKSLENVFGLKINSFIWIRIQDLRPGIFLTLDPGWKNSDQGSGIGEKYLGSATLYKDIY